MFNFNVDLAAECIKSICVNTQCVTCDKLIGPGVRFPCGHSICQGCAQKIGECLLCISSPVSYVIDGPQTARLNNASALLTVFQDTFKIDVNRRQRISDHLKVEKQVFPQCIQAPHKYSNNRKSLNTSFNNKENISPQIFWTEEIKIPNKVIMKKSAEYVQNWLNHHESVPQNLPRRPFGDISVNGQSLIPKTNQDVVKLKKVTTRASAKKSNYRAMSHLKTIHKSSSVLNNVVKANLEIKNLSKQLELKKDNTYSQMNYKCDRNESGIVLDDEAILINDDIDSKAVDKDELALLAVLKAAEKDQYEDSEKENNKLCNDGNNLFKKHKKAGSILLGRVCNSEKIESRLIKNVLFFQKSSLFETCKLCNDNFKTKINSSPKVNTSNDVSIIINNSAFITTIKFTNQECNKPTVDKTSIAIQTEDEIQLPQNKVIDCEKKITPQKRMNKVDTDGIPKKLLKPNNIYQSLDVFATDNYTKPDSPDKSFNRQKQLVIEDSDTDSNESCNNTQKVIADIHKSIVPESVEYGILRTLSKMEYEHKTKRQARGHTPNSSNSSDKENLDPNRKKVVKCGKKRKNKK